MGHFVYRFTKSHSFLNPKCTLTAKRNINPRVGFCVYLKASLFIIFICSGGSN